MRQDLGEKLMPQQRFQACTCCLMRLTSLHVLAAHGSSFGQYLHSCPPPSEQSYAAVLSSCLLALHALDINSHRHTSQESSAAYKMLKCN